MTRVRAVATLSLAVLLAACGGEPAESPGAAGTEAADPVPSRPQTAVARLLDCAREEGATLISAHRGGPAAGIPENSLAAIRHAAATGAAFAEIDLARSADGAIVLMHDETLDRTTTGEGPVSGLYLNELRELRLRDAGGAVTEETVPTLDEAFAVALDAGIFLQLDLKSVGAGEAARIAGDVGQAGRTLVIAYTVEAGREARTAESAIGLSLGVEDPATLEATGLDTDGLFAWLGGGVPSSSLDADFAAIAVETGAHAFLEEAEGGADYIRWREAGVEVLAVDDVAAAAAALGAAREHCPAVFR